MHFDAAVGDVANRQVLYCQSATSLAQAAKMMKQRGCSSIVIKEDTQVVGIWTEADAIKLDFNQPDIMAQPIALHMSSPVHFTCASTPVGKVVELFRKYGFRHCLIDYGTEQAPGIISQTDITLNINIDHFLTLCKVKAAQELCLTFNLGVDFAEAVDTMRQRKTDAAVVVNSHQEPVGIVTQADALTVLAGETRLQPVEQMQAQDLVTITNEDSLLTARDTLQKNKIRHLIVTNEAGRVEGVISMRHILQFLQLEYSAQLSEALSRRDQALKRSMQDLNLAERVFEHALEGIVITDGKGVIIRVNPAFSSLTGYPESEVLGRNMRMLSSGKHNAGFYQAIWQQLLGEGSWSGEIWNKRKNGELFLEWLTISAVYDDSGHISNFTGLFRDVTRIREQEQKIRHLAYFDELTGLPNRRFLKEHVSEAISNAKQNHHQMAVIFIDLDQFKRINDNFSHEVGDNLLIELGQRLSTLTHNKGTLARLGGDEFVIVLPHIHSYTEISELGKQINDNLRTPFSLNAQHSKQLTVSIGASIYPDDGASVEDLLRHADTAMYSVKANGRNGLQLFSQEMAQRSMQHFTMEANLRNAIQHDEFTLHFQPKVTVDTGKISGLEALLRWNQKDLGSVSPANFIPLAEEAGLIQSIDQWVIDNTCAQLSQWIQRGLAPIPVAVNISPLSLRRPDLVDMIKQTLDANRISASLLQVEITENAFIDDMDSVVRQLHAIRQLGITIALDDFGTGYSSLSYLAQMPIDELKIDASFIRNVPDCDTSDSLIKAITGIARNLELSVVVEGVETVQQLSYVEALQCDQVQGYLTGRPVPASAIETRLSNGHQHWAANGDN